MPADLAPPEARRLAAHYRSVVAQLVTTARVLGAAAAAADLTPIKEVEHDHYKRNLDIVQQDRDGTTLRRWSLSRAWPVKFVAGDWDNEADENVIESVTLTYDFFELVQ